MSSRMPGACGRIRSAGNVGIFPSQARVRADLTSLRDWYASTMVKVLAGMEYLMAGLVGLVMAMIATALISIAIFPADGPIGEGFAMMFIYFICCCACVPGYAALMNLHRAGRRGGA